MTSESMPVIRFGFLSPSQVKVEHDLRAQVTAFLHRVPRVSELLLDHVYRACHNGRSLSRQVLAKLGYFTTFDFVRSVAGVSVATRNGVRVLLFGEVSRRAIECPKCVALYDCPRV